MTDEKQQLFNELKKLSKRANQRILRLERLTGKQGLFATKQLYDYLSSDLVQGLSKSGRVRASTAFSETQMIAIIKATEDFLASTYSTTGTVKKLKAEIEKSIGKKVSFTELSAIYQSQDLWQWVKNEFASSFWTDMAPVIFETGKLEWVKIVINYYQKSNDKDVKDKLKAIYDYIKKHGLNGVVRID